LASPLHDQPEPESTRVVAAAPLSYTGTTSEYEGSITVPESAPQLRVMAVDAGRANAGAATVDLSMEAE
jgi:hypothetical protein